MDWKTLAAAFTTIFLAELGDKTQLATMAMAGRPGSRLAVFLGAAAALVLTSALSILAADLVNRVISPVWLRRVSGALLVGLGLMMLLGRDSA